MCQTSALSNSQYANYWVILGSLGNIYEMYVNLTVTNLLNQNHFWITRTELYLANTLQKQVSCLLPFSRYFWKSSKFIFRSYYKHLPFSKKLYQTEMNFTLLIYTFFFSIFCVSQEGLNLMESNQQIYDFYKWALFEKQGQCGRLQSKFLYQ